MNIGDVTTGQAELARRVNQPASKLSFLEPLPPELLRIFVPRKYLSILSLPSRAYGRPQKLG